MTHSISLSFLSRSQGFFGALEQNPALQGNGYSQRATKFIPTDSDKRLNHKILTEYSVKNPSLKGRADNESVCREGKVVEKSVKSKRGGGNSVAVNLESKSSGLFSAEKTPYKSVPVGADCLKGARNRDKKVKNEVPAGKEIMCQKETDQIESVGIGQVPSSILYQGRKNHDHFSNEGKAYKKYDSEGGRIPMSRDKRQFMVSLKETNWQARKIDGENNSDDSGLLVDVQKHLSTTDVLVTEWLKEAESSTGVMDDQNLEAPSELGEINEIVSMDGPWSPGSEKSQEDVTTSSYRDMRPLRNKLKEVESKAFGAHLKEVIRRKAQHKNFNVILDHRAQHHLASQSARFLKYEIEEGMREYRSWAQEVSVNEFIEKENDAMVRNEVEEVYKEFFKNEKMYKEHEEDVRQYESNAEQNLWPGEALIEEYYVGNDDGKDVGKDARKDVDDNFSINSGNIEEFASFTFGETSACVDYVSSVQQFWEDAFYRDKLHAGEEAVLGSIKIGINNVQATIKGLLDHQKHDEEALNGPIKQLVIKEVDNLPMTLLDTGITEAILNPW